jgi:hypothetical protein
VDFQAQLHSELIAFIRQHTSFSDHRHLVLLAWMVTELFLSQTVCVDHSKAALPIGRCLAGSWQRDVQCWLSSARIDEEVLCTSLVLWVIQQWQKSSHSLHLTLNITVLSNRFRVVVVSVVSWHWPSDTQG